MPATLTRRDFLRRSTSFSASKNQSKKGNQPASDSSPLGAELDVFSNLPLSTDELTHLLKRTMFGMKKGDHSFFSGKNLPEIVDNYLLNFASSAPLPIPTGYTTDAFQNTLAASWAAGQDPYGLTAIAPQPPVNDYETDESMTNGTTTIAFKIHDNDVPAGKPWILSRFSGVSSGNGYGTGATSNLRRDRWRSYMGWWFRQMTNQPYSMREKMTAFWYNFFPSDWNRAFSIYTDDVYWYNQLLRHHAIGDFKTLVRKVSTSHSMLIFLDGYLNTKNTPNQNYGRELQEIYCLGLPPADAMNPNSYTEQDVIEVSRILTGWTIDTARPYLATKFDPAKHDTGNKQLSAFYGNAVITGQSGANGANELDQLLALMFNTDAPSLNVVRKIYRFFVNPRIDADAEANVIQPLAQILRDNNYQLKPMLSVLLKSNHFFDLRLRGGMVKSPLDYVVGLHREFPVTFSHPTNPRYVYEWSYYMMLDRIPNFGQAWQFPDAFGWRALYYGPFFDQNWLNASTLYYRRNLFTSITGGSFTRNNTIIQIPDPASNWSLTIDLPDFVKTKFINPADAVKLVDEVLAYSIPVDLCQSGKNNLLVTLQGTSNNWTTVWNNWKNNPGSTSYYNTVRSRLLNFFRAVVGLEEYQMI